MKKLKYIKYISTVLTLTTAVNGFAFVAQITPDYADNGKINVETDANGDYVAVKACDEDGNIVYLGFEENSGTGKFQKSIAVGKDSGTYTVGIRGSKDYGVVEKEVTLDGILCKSFLTDAQYGITEIGDTIAVSADIVNMEGADTNVRLSAAAYDDNDRLIGIESKTVTVASGEKNISLDIVVPDKTHEMKFFLWDETQKPLKTAIKVSVPEKLYVSTAGNDDNDGSEEKPLATVQKALEVAAGKEDKVNIVLREGTYYQNDSIKINEENSKVVISSYGDENVKISGAVNIANESFKSVTDEEMLSRLPKSSRDYVKAVNLSELGISGAGQIYHINYHTGKPAFETLSVGGVRGTLARWPNEGYAQATSIVKNEFAKKADGSDDTIYAYKGNMEFTYEDDRADNWTADGSGWIIGYWKHSWAQDSMQIAEINPETNTIKTNGASSMSPKAEIPGGRWYAFNLPEELDMPGEWMVKDDVLYLYPPTGMEKEDVQLTTKFLNGIEMNNANDVVIKGITFENFRGHGIILNNCENVNLSDLEIRNTSRWAVNINGGKNCSVKGCEMYNLSLGGIYASGGDTNTLTGSGHEIIDNGIHDYALEGRCYEPGISLSGVGTRVANNEIYNAPHIGISFNGNEFIIEYNDIHDVVEETGDAGAIYCHGSYFGMGTQIRYNYIHNIDLFYKKSSPYIPGGAVAIYFDDQYSGVSAYGNIIENCQRGFLFNAGRYAKIYGNIIYDQPKNDPDVHAMNIQSQSENGQAYNNFEAFVKTLDKNAWDKKYPGILDELIKDYDDNNLLQPKGNEIINNVIVNHGTAEITSEVSKYSTVYGNNVAQYKQDILGLVVKKATLDDVVYKKGGIWKKIPNTKWDSTVPDFEPIEFYKIGRLTK